MVYRAARPSTRRAADATNGARWPSGLGPTLALKLPTRRCNCRRLRLLSEYGIEKIVRDLRVHQILEGTNEIMRLIVSRKLIEGAR